MAGATPNASAAASAPVAAPSPASSSAQSQLQPDQKTAAPATTNPAVASTATASNNSGPALVVPRTLTALTAFVDKDWVLAHPPSKREADMANVRPDRVLKVESVHLRSVWLKEWNIRWLVLRRDALLYFKNAAPVTRETPRGRIELSDMASVRADPERALTFQVNTKSGARHYLFQCYSEQEVTSWVTALNRILAGTYDAWEREQRELAERIRYEIKQRELAREIAIEQSRVNQIELQLQQQLIAAAAADASAATAATATATAPSAPSADTKSDAAATAGASPAAVAAGRAGVKPDPAARGDDLVERILFGLNPAKSDAVNIAVNAPATPTKSGAAAASNGDYTPASYAGLAAKSPAPNGNDFTPLSLPPTGGHEILFSSHVVVPTTPVSAKSPSAKSFNSTPKSSSKH